MLLSQCLQVCNIFLGKIIRIIGRATDASLKNLVKDRSFVYVQPKYDGERIMLHKMGDDMKLFTRHAFDVTNRWNYGSRLNNIMKYIKTQNCILDGELVSWNKIDNCIMAFGSNRNRVRQKDSDVSGDEGIGQSDEDNDPVEADTQLFYVVFDVIMINDVVIMNLSLEERLRKLRELIPVEAEHLLEIV